MKILFSIFFLFSLNFVFAQQCGCDSIPVLNETISCEPVLFKNHAKLYWQFNCDSSWLSFENRNGKKTNLYTLELVEYTGRLGYSYAAEYKSVFLIQNNVISGCCDPPEFFLFNKENGKLKTSLGRLVYYSDDPALPYIVYITNSNYNSFDRLEYNSLTLLNVDNNKRFITALPKGRIDKTMQITGELFPEHLFEEAVVENGFIKISYRYQNKGQKDKWFAHTIMIRLKK